VNTVEQLTEELLKYIKQTKYQFLNINEVTNWLKKRLGDNYSSELSIAVKNALTNHDKLDFFREGTYIYENKYYYCTGNWLATKGLYENPVEAKDKMGWYAWQDKEEVDFTA
jgi:hypothetical protein